MKIISIYLTVPTVVSGRMSDGSDREEHQEKRWVVIASVEKFTYKGEFIQEDEPSAVEIQSAFEEGRFINITTDRDKINQLEAENLELKLALAELAEVKHQDNKDVQIALAKLAGLIAGRDA